MQKTQVLIRKLKIDRALNIRHNIDEETVKQYTEKQIEEPVVVYNVDGTLYLVDGFHRIEAWHRLERDWIWAYVVKGDMEEAQTDSIVANVKHGKPYTPNELKDAADRLLKIHTTKSNRAIASMLGWNDKAIAKRRRVLIEAQEIQDVQEVEGEDGRTYKSKMTETQEKAHAKKGQFQASQMCLRIYAASESQWEFWQQVIRAGQHMMGGNAKLTGIIENMFAEVSDIWFHQTAGSDRSDRRYHWLRLFQRLVDRAMTGKHWVKGEDKKDLEEIKAIIYRMIGKGKQKEKKEENGLQELL